MSTLRRFIEMLPPLMFGDNIDHALADLALLEADAAVGAAVRECEDLRLHLSGGFYDDANAFLVWAHGDHGGVVPGPTLPAALASWKERNEVAG